MLGALLPASFLLTLGTNGTGKQSAPGGPFHVCDPRAAAHQRKGTGEGVCSSSSLGPSGPFIHHLLSIAYAFLFDVPCGLGQVEGKRK